MQVSGKGALGGFVADMLLSSFPIGTGIGALAKNLFGLNSNDMSAAHDQQGAEKRSFDWSSIKSSFETGDWNKMKNDLTDMGRSLFGNPKNADAPLRPERDNPENEATARQMTDKKKGGFSLGKKALLAGGALLAGAVVMGGVADMAMFGFGFPLFGAFMTPFFF